MPNFWTNMANNGLPLFIATVIAAAILALVRRTGQIAKGLKNIPKLEAGLRLLFVVNDKQNHVMQSNLEISKALIDAVESGVCNGNIRGAKERQAAALDIAKGAREDAQEFLVGHSVGTEA